VLAPYAEYITGTSTFRAASVSHYLGMLATTFERSDQAQSRFRTAAGIHERIGAPALLARTRLEAAAVGRRCPTPVGPACASATSSDSRSSCSPPRDRW
jgi:hypothetical protein